jgi:hypothetical protein
VKLNQILAVEAQVKKSSHELSTDAYQKLQKESLFGGQTRTYRPLDEDGEKLPPETNIVQATVVELLRSVQVAMSPLFDATLAKDSANCEAKADVIVDGKAVLSSVPVTYLLWLDKQLTDLHTVICKVPTLSASEKWTFDEAQNLHRSEVSDTMRTKKIPRAFIKAEATQHHPAQVEMVHEDKPAGIWSTVKYCGALPKSRAQELRDRIEKLMASVKVAREQANLSEAPKVSAADKIFGYLFA